MDGIQVNDGVDTRQRSILPRLHQRPDLLGDSANRRRRDVHAVQLGQRPGDVAGGQPASVHGQNLLFQLIGVAGVPGQYLRLEFAVPVARYLYPRLPGGGAHLLGVTSVTVVARVATSRFIRLVAQVLGQLPLQHLFQGRGKEFGEHPFFAEEVVHRLNLAQFSLHFLRRGHILLGRCGLLLFRHRVTSSRLSGYTLVDFWLHTIPDTTS